MSSIGATQGRRRSLAGLIESLEPGERGGAAALAFIAAFVSAWALAPGAVEALPLVGDALASTGRLLIGRWPSSLYAAGVFDIAALYGLASLLSARSVLAREARAIAEVEESCSKDRAGVVRRSSEGRSPFFSTGYDRIQNVGGLAVYAMTENIRKDAENFRYEPIAMIVERVAGPIFSGSAGLKDAQQIGVRLGILGTFIGMSFALIDVTDIFQTSGDAAFGERATVSVVDNLSLGFGTSIAGLVAAILLQIVSGSLRAREDRLLRKLQELAAELQGIYRAAEIGGSIGRDIDLLRETIGEHRRDLQSHRLGIAGHAETIIDATRDVARGFAGPLDGIRETGERLASLLADQHRAIDALSAAGERVAGLQGDLFAAFDQALERSGEREAERHAAFRAEIAAMAGSLAGEMRIGFQGAGELGQARALVHRLDTVALRLDDLLLAQRAFLRRLLIVLASLAALAGGTIVVSFVSEILPALFDSGTTKATEPASSHEGSPT